MQTQGIPMGGNASPFIADLCLAWAEYCFIVELPKSKNPSDFELAKVLSNNSRYIDDISVVNFLGFGELSKRIYHKDLLLEESTFSYRYDNFLDLSVRVYADKFVMGIYHKVDDFNFEVINFPFPESNIHSKIGYNSFYSQLVRFFRLCNNIYDFCVRVRMLYRKLHTRGYSKSILSRFFLKFCSRYPIDIKYNVSDGNALWNSVLNLVATKSCCIYDYEAIDEIVKPCHVVLDRLSVNDDCLSCTQSSEPTSDQIVDSETGTIQPSIDDTLGLQTGGILPQSLENPRNHCYINSILQVIYRIFMHFNEGVHFNNNRQGCLVKCLVDGIYSDATDSLSQFKIMLARFDSFFSGHTQQDVSECFSYLMDILHLSTKQNLLCDTLNSSYSDELSYSLTKRLFLYNLKHITQCIKCRFITSVFTESHMHIIYPLDNSTVMDMLKSSLDVRVSKFCGCCNVNTDHTESISFEQPPEILSLVISRFDSNSTNKNTDSIKINRQLHIASQNYNLIGSIHHHGRTIASGHYTANIFYQDSAFLCNDSQVIPLNNFESSNSVYMLFYARNGESVG